MMKRLLYIIIVLLCVKTAKGQDPQFSQPYAAPLYLNPAFTGTTEKYRVSFTYRNQWSAIDNGFTSYMASYDQNVKKLNMGFGGYLLYDQSGANGYRVTGINLSYSYDARIDRWSGLKGGVAAGYDFMSFNPNDLLFADQIIRDGAPTSVEQNIGDHTSYLDLAAGVLYYNKFLWAGVSANHLNTPNISMTNQVQRLPMKFSVHAGVNVWNRRGEWGRELSSLNLVVHYKHQAKWDQLDIGAYYNFFPVVIGLWYRGIPLMKSYEQNYSNHESLILLIGLDYKNKFRIGYSYDYTISELSISSGGSHEISIIYEWPSSTKKSRLRRVACPKF